MGQTIKKFLSSLVAGALGLSLAACGPAPKPLPSPLPTAQAIVAVAASSTPVPVATSTLRPTAGATLDSSLSTQSPRPATATSLSPGVLAATGAPQATSTHRPPDALTPTSQLATSAPEMASTTPPPGPDWPSVTPPDPTPVIPPTALPSPAVSVLLPNQPLVPPAGVRVYEQSISIPTYDYPAGLVASQADDPIYPYPHLDMGRVGGPQARVYRAVVLENAYMRVTILPELGGRVYAWEDKSTGRAVVYSNPVIKPTHWGYRGWWLATGGLEWCLPTDEHGLNEYRPWQVSLGGNSVVVSDHEDRTGLDVQVTLSLDSAHNSLTIRPRITNNTPAAQRFKFWINAMLAFSGNRVSDDTYFIMPGDQATVHSTGDSGLPGPGSQIAWPVYQGRDLSRLGNLDGWLGVFASPAAQADFAGAYDAAADRGIVRTFPAILTRGVKFFSGRSIDPAVWTDDGSTYFELWGGLRPTFADEAVIEAGQSFTWSERWYPVNGLGGDYGYANAAAALRLEDQGSSVRASLAASANLAEAHIRLWQAQRLVGEWTASLGPGRPVSLAWERPSDADQGPLGLQLLDASGAVLAQVGTIGQD